MADELERTYGTNVQAISQSSTIADDEVVGGNTEFTHAAGEDYPHAEATLHIPSGFGATPAGPILLFMVRGDVRGGTDNDTGLGYAALTTTDNQTDPEDAELVCAFPGGPDTGAYRKTLDILLPVSSARYYIQNKTGTTLVATSNVTLDITPYTSVPGA